MKSTRQLIFAVMFYAVFFTAIQSVNCESAQAQLLRQPIRTAIRDFEDFKRDYHYDRPFQYSPSDPWQRGKVFQWHTGHSGFFYNCDGEECKRESPYICWKVHFEEDIPARKGFCKCLACDIAEIKRRICDGSCGGCGHPQCDDPGCQGQCASYGASYDNAYYGGEQSYGQQSYGQQSWQEGYNAGPESYQHDPNYFEGNPDGGLQSPTNGFEPYQNMPVTSPAIDGGYGRNRRPADRNSSGSMLTGLLRQRGDDQPRIDQPRIDQPRDDQRGNARDREIASPMTNTRVANARQRLEQNRRAAANFAPTQSRPAASAMVRPAANTQPRFAASAQPSRSTDPAQPQRTFATQPVRSLLAPRGIETTQPRTAALPPRRAATSGTLRR